MKDPEMPEMLGVRLDPKLRYLAEIAARARGCNLSTYVEWALLESFKSVTLRRPVEPEPTYGHDPNNIVNPPEPDPENERIQNEAMSVANMADVVWDENPCKRLHYLNYALPHLMTDEDSRIWGYIHSSDEFKKPTMNGYKLNRELIAREWKRIKHESLQPKPRKEK